MLRRRLIVLSLFLFLLASGAPSSAFAFAGDEPQVIAGPIEIPGSTHGYYLLSNSSADAARDKAMELGGTLATFESIQEMAAVRSALSDFGGIPRNTWIGLSDAREEGDWRWATGEFRVFEAWGPDEPATAPDLDQAYMTPDGRWYAADASASSANEQLLYSIVEVGDVDCNQNFYPDFLDIQDGESLDLDGDGVPDECQSEDCDANGRPDAVELMLAPWLDCNDDGIVDACAAIENPKSDCNGNLLADECESPDAVGFLTTYFTGNDLQTPILSRIEDVVDLDIGDGAPWDGAGFRDFAARWSGEFQAPYTGFYSFWINSDDGVRFSIDGELLVDDWRAHPPEEVTAGVFLSAGPHVLNLDWFDSGGGALCTLEWQPPFGSRQLMPGSVMRPFVDCDGNGVLDGCDLALDPSRDCNANGRLDDCEESASDCNGDGIYDWCQLQDNDCDGNGVPDDCELDAGAPDCQLDGILDVCQSGERVLFANDDGGPEYGVRAAGTYMAWLQHVVIDSPYASAVAIEVDFVFVEEGRTGRVCIWRDPDGDGNPDDAELVHIEFIEVQSFEPGVRDRIELPNVGLGPIGGSYFIGAMMGGVGEEDYPAALDATTPYAGGSWIIGSEQPLDPTDLNGEGVVEFSRLDQLGPGVWWSNWVLRLEYETSSGDCDGDGVPDECQIAAGELVDLDGNGVVDLCEDCDGDGVVDRCELTCGGDCGILWDTDCGQDEDCNGDSIPDSCQSAFTGLPDCDGNGIPDACEPSSLDCDGNGVLDACEFAAGTAEDCNGDGVIDSCQFGGHPGYRIDTGIVSSTIGFGSGGATWWAIQFEVGAGDDARIVDFVDVAVGELTIFGGGGLVQIGLMADPDQDRSPADMVPLALGTLVSRGPNEAGQGEPVFTRFEFDPVDLGPVGTSFFVAAFVDPLDPVFPCVLDSVAFEGRSFIGRGSSLEDITASYSLGGLGAIGEWVMRAGRTGEPPIYDCNRNLKLDTCDIDAGTSLDLDLDGRPDECDIICPADFDGDGIVGGSDLGLFLLQWQALNARADLNGDGVVDGEDFGAFLIAWGVCA